MMENRVILLTTGLSQYFGGLAALKKVDVTVREGEIHGLIGPNGAGKTTFANVVSGLLRPTEGKIHFNGTEITNVDPHIIASIGLSRTFQRAQIFPRMNCLQNVMVGHHPRIKSSILKTMFRPPFFRWAEEDEAKRRALELLQLVGISDSAERMGTDLVWVECQLVQIARSIANEPKLLILDEPTSGMGVEESQIIGRLSESHGGRPWGGLTPMTWDMIHMIKAAVEHQGITGDPAKLKEERIKIKDYAINQKEFKGLEATYDIVNGLAVGYPQRLFQIRNDEAMLVEEFKPKK